MFPDPFRGQINTPAVPALLHFLLNHLFSKNLEFGLRRFEGFFSLRNIAGDFISFFWAVIEVLCYKNGNKMAII